MSQTQPAIQFYHLLHTPMERALPKLVEKAYAQGMRIHIKGTAEQCDLLDKVLWTYDPDSFLPHGHANDENPSNYPILLSEETVPANGASLLIITDGSSYSGEASYERVCDMFDGAHEPSTQAARDRWKGYLDSGYPLTYIRQKETGGWEKVKEANTQEEE